MEWNRLELSVKDAKRSQSKMLEVSDTGLDITAEIMHDRFLNNLPHLEGVKISHMNMMSEISNMIESEKDISRENRSIELFLSDVGGTISDHNIKIPLETEFPREIIIETAKGDNSNLVRIITPEIFGGIMSTFEISEDKKIIKGEWSNGFLELKLE
jgi:hypothetical protein|tara:strand:- start:83 stop:553 length:471 start_codon:yes stop_codon:yes gene_type:complete